LYASGGCRRTRGADCRQIIRFRDYLRAHADVVAAYAELKLRLAQQFATDFPAYHAVKDTFIKQVVHAAFADVQEPPYGCNP